MDFVDSEDSKMAREAQDLEYAKMVHAKEKAKLKRAKERSRQKKLLQQQENPEVGGAGALAASAGPRTESRNSRNSRNGHTPQHSFDGAAEPRLESRKSQSSFNENNHAEDIINDDESVISAPPPTATIELPARRPYMNTGAIDSHKSAFAHETSNEADESELSEPQYANVGPNKYYNEPSPPHIRQN